jgi:hypothetical protein
MPIKSGCVQIDSDSQPISAQRPRYRAAQPLADAIGFVAGTIDDLHTWIQHLDAVGAEHSPLVTALAGQLLVFPDSDGT